MKARVKTIVVSLTAIVMIAAGSLFASPASASPQTPGPDPAADNAAYSAWVKHAWSPFFIALTLVNAGPTLLTDYRPWSKEDLEFVVPLYAIYWIYGKPAGTQCAGAYAGMAWMAQIQGNGAIHGAVKIDDGSVYPVLIFGSPVPPLPPYTLDYSTRRTPGYGSITPDASSHAWKSATNDRSLGGPQAWWVLSITQMAADGNPGHDFAFCTQ